MLENGNENGAKILYDIFYNMRKNKEYLDHDLMKEYDAWKPEWRKDIQKIVVVGGGRTAIDYYGKDYEHSFIIGTQSSPPLPYDLGVLVDSREVAALKMYSTIGERTPVVAGMQTRAYGYAPFQETIIIPMRQQSDLGFAGIENRMLNLFFKAGETSYILQMGNVVNAILALIELMVVGKRLPDVDVELFGCDLSLGRENDAILYEHWNDIWDDEKPHKLVDGDWVIPQFLVYEEQMEWLVKQMKRKVTLGHDKPSRLRRFL